MRSLITLEVIVASGATRNARMSADLEGNQWRDYTDDVGGWLLKIDQISGIQKKYQKNLKKFFESIQNIHKN